MNNFVKYQVLWVLFKLFEGFLFLLPAFPSSFLVRLGVLVIYLISHIAGVQMYYKEFKHNTLDTYASPLSFTPIQDNMDELKKDFLLFNK